LFEICVGYLILGVLLGLGIAIFSYKISNMNTKEGTPSASHNSRSMPCEHIGTFMPISNIAKCEKCGITMYVK